MLVSALVVQASIAAFSDTTNTQGGEWTAGSVTLTDDDGTGHAAFTPETNMVPTDSDQACITVTYDGTVAAAINMYGSTSFNSGSDLGQYLDLTIDEVTVGGGTCASPDSVDNTVYDGTLSVNAGAFTVDHTSWGDGAAAAWAPSSNDSQVFRITVTLQDDDNAQGLDTTATFNWEAQSQSS